MTAVSAILAIKAATRPSPMVLRRLKVVRLPPKCGIPLEGADPDIGSLIRATPDRRTGRAILPQHRLDALAQRIEPMATWDDLALPPRDLAKLREIAGNIRRRHAVEPTPDGPGTGILFSGGTGAVKTQAAEALARDLNLGLFRVDLSGVISKYIGETEKNLRRLFEAAEAGGAILLFDEADALFGKRSKVKDSHDRFAQIELDYLLQRIEAFDGVTILAVKSATRPSPAVLRRLKVVRFPTEKT
jgi:hypothetical protein